MKGYEQRREDIMSCRSDNLHTLMTFQGQKSRGGGGGGGGGRGLSYKDHSMN